MGPEARGGLIEWEKYYDFQRPHVKIFLVPEITSNVWCKENLSGELDAVLQASWPT